MKENFKIGWENYYRSNSNQAWKNEPDTFLLDNLSLIPNSNQIKVLDIASGDGRNTFVFTDNSIYDICCVDLSKTALQKISSFCQKEKLKTPLLIADDFLDINFCSNQFDIIICFDGLPQMEDAQEVIKKMCDILANEGKLFFNYFTKGDCAYGIGEKLNDNSFLYKETLFKFMNYDDIIPLIPSNMKIVKSEVKRWNDPPHGQFRPEPHTHEAVFFILEKIDNNET